MPKYVIEREIPGAGKLSAEQLKSISQTSCAVLNDMGPQIQWIHSHVTGDKVYCLYRAPNEQRAAITRSRAAFPPTAFPKSSPPSIRPRRSSGVRGCGRHAIRAGRKFGKPSHKEKSWTTYDLFTASRA